MKHSGKLISGALLFAGLTGLHGCGTDTGEEADVAASADEAQDDSPGVGEVHWSYEGETGPDLWGSLDESFGVCQSGMAQSPVDISGAMAGGDGQLEIMWNPSTAEVGDNGHTIQVDVTPGSTINLDGRNFSLLQFHFHAASEHTVDGTASPMEVHFVHQAEEGDLGVIGVLMEIGDQHASVQDIWDAIPVDGSMSTMTDFDLRSLLPGSETHFRYAGSLTTPPCSEVVSWVVMSEPIRVSAEQVEAFQAIHPVNARPVQPLNEREIQLLN